MSVKQKVLEIFEANEWLTMSDLASYFEAHEKGAYSLHRYITFLRADGHKIAMRHRAESTWEYKLVREPKQTSLFEGG